MPVSKILGVVLLSALSLVISACGTGGGGDGKGTVELALVASGDTNAAYKAQVKRFNSSQDDITLKLRTYSSGEAYEQALTGQVAGGQAPDVFLLDAGVKTREYAKAGAIMPLDDVVKDAGVDMGAFSDNLVKAGKVDGKAYAVPKDYSTTALFYHKSMLKEAGVKPPTTWAELRSAAKKLTKQDRYGLGMFPQLNYFLAWIQAADGNFVTDSGVEDVDNPGHVAAVEHLLTLFNKNKSAATPQMTGAGWDGEMLAKKQVAMAFGGTWIPGGLPKDVQEDIGAVAFPPKDQQGSVLYAAGWAVSAETEDPAAAAEVVKFLTSDKELVAGHEDGIVLIPPKQSALDKLTASGGDPVLDLAAESASTGIPFGLLAPKTVDTYNATLERLIAKKASPSSAGTEVRKLAGELE